MHYTDVMIVGFEFKAAAAGEPEGTISGYGSVFGNIDAHGDRVLPGAFVKTLAARAGAPIPMHYNHGLPHLGGVRAIGVWDEYAEDGKGLRLKGKMAGMNTEIGRYRYDQVKTGAVAGLSIGYKALDNGFTLYKSRDDGLKRDLTNVYLGETSLVDDPCNAEAVVDQIKSYLNSTEFKAASTDAAAAAVSLGHAMMLHDAAMNYGSDYGTSYGPAAGMSKSKRDSIIMQHLQDAHSSLTGSRTPPGMVGWAKSMQNDDLMEIKSVLDRILGPDAGEDGAARLNAALASLGV